MTGPVPQTAVPGLVLALLRREPARGQTARELADALGLDPDRAHTALRALLKSGLVVRERVRREVPVVRPYTLDRDLARAFWVHLYRAVDTRSVTPPARDM